MNQAQGAIALLGSGEYLPVMRQTDQELLTTVGGPKAATVALIPAASGLEPGAPERWNRLGVEHFAALGAQPLAVPLVTREDTARQPVLELLRRANVYYFSGGNPAYLVNVLRDTEAWAIIQAAHRAGAVVAGCSAGAIMLADWMGGLRSVLAGGHPTWTRALGVARGIVAMPHFDRFASRVGQQAIRRWASRAPDGATLVGIDEDTALLRPGAGQPWRVSGRQTVSVFRRYGEIEVYQAGETVPLD